MSSITLFINNILYILQKTTNIKNPTSFPRKTPETPHRKRAAAVTGSTRLRTVRTCQINHFYCRTTRKGGLLFNSYKLFVNIYICIQKVIYKNRQTGRHGKSFEILSRFLVFSQFYGTLKTFSLTYSSRRKKRNVINLTVMYVCVCVWLWHCNF